MVIGTNLIKSNILTKSVLIKSILDCICKASFPRSYLEKDRLSVLAFGARVILRPGQSGIADDVRVDVGDFIHLMHNFVDVNAVVVGDLLVIAVPARVQQLPLLLVLFGVEHVVALLTEPDTHESGAVGMSS